MIESMVHAQACLIGGVRPQPASSDVERPARTSSYQDIERHPDIELVEMSGGLDKLDHPGSGAKGMRGERTALTIGVTGWVVFGRGRSRSSRGSMNATWP
ncbi:MAG: hypothetical protein ACTHOK_13250 [Nocardioidaceae bacterium]